MHVQYDPSNQTPNRLIIMLICLPSIHICSFTILNVSILGFLMIDLINELAALCGPTVCRALNKRICYSESQQPLRQKTVQLHIGS